MPDETTVTDTASADAVPATESTAVTPPADATGSNSGATDRTFTQADIDRIIKDRLEQERGKAQKQAEKAQAEAEAKVLAEQGKYKELFEKQQAELQAAQAEARSASIKVLQRDAATQANLPLPLADRLKGDTLDEMVADAKAIMAALPKPAVPNINANSGAGGAPVPGQMTDDEKAALAAVLGVNPKFM